MYLRNLEARGRALVGMVSIAVLVGVVGFVAVSAASAQGEAEPPRALEIDDPTIYPEYPDADPDAPTPRLRIVFDLVTHETELAIDPHTPFDFWVVAHDVQIALRAWEAKLVIDPRLLILERDVEGLNLGRGDEIRTAYKPADCKSGVTMTLARLRAMVPEEGMSDLVLGLAPVERSSFDPPATGYLVCRPGADLRSFAACDTCAVVNPISVRPDPDPSSANPLRDVLTPVRGR